VDNRDDVVVRQLLSLPFSQSAICQNYRGALGGKSHGPKQEAMEVLTPKVMRRSTRIRVEIPVNVLSLDRMRPFAENCMVLVVSAQGCGFRSSRPLQLETPIMLNALPGGSVAARVANCLPLGNEGFLIGASLYTHGNVWGIANPPDDWKIAAQSTPAPAPKSAGPSASAPLKVTKKQWPYNLFDEGTENRLEKK
jgi:hypothetical protein